MAVERLETGYLRTSVSREPANTDRVLNYHSEHARSAKIAVARALMARVETKLRQMMRRVKNGKSFTLSKFLRLMDIRLVS